jgi:hypothetical protein
LNLKNATQSERIAELIDRYAEFKSSKAKEEKARAARLSDSLGTFWPQFADAVTASKARERSEASKFNLIRLLDLHQLERNHSKILAEFDPKGTHGQGTLFLEGFLDQIGRGHLKPKLAGAHIEVKKELWTTEYGRLDIVVRCFTGSITHFILVVENKIKSGESNGGDEGLRQLEKYKLWLDKQITEPGGKILVFLTIHGDRPRIEGTAVPISYLRDIRQWLNLAQCSIQAPRVRHTVEQYLDIIEELKALRRERIYGDG